MIWIIIIVMLDICQPRSVFFTSFLIPETTLQGRYYYVHFTGDIFKKLSRLGSYSQKVPDLNSFQKTVGIDFYSSKTCNSFILPWSIVTSSLALSSAFYLLPPHFWERLVRSCWGGEDLLCLLESSKFKVKILVNHIILNMTDKQYIGIW